MSRLTGVVCDGLTRVHRGPKAFGKVEEKSLSSHVPMRLPSVRSVFLSECFPLFCETEPYT